MEDPSTAGGGDLYADNDHKSEGGTIDDGCGSENPGA